MGLAATGIGRSGMTSLTAELAASSLASPCDTVAEMALTREKLFTLRASSGGQAGPDLAPPSSPSSRAAPTLLGVSGRPVTWFLKTMITLSVTLRDSARACAAVSSAPARRGPRCLGRGLRRGRQGHQQDGCGDRDAAQQTRMSHVHLSPQQAPGRQKPRPLVQRCALAHKPRRANGLIPSPHRLPESAAQRPGGSEAGRPGPAGPAQAAPHQCRTTDDHGRGCPVTHSPL